MSEQKVEVPEDRCEFTLLDSTEVLDPDSFWVVRAEPVCCWRPAWESHDETERCIWHADVDEKPLAELIATRTDSPERLDGAILRNLHKEDGTLALGDCQLRKATFDGAEFPETDFSNADLNGATFTDAHLVVADFIDADLQDAKLSDADAREASFRHASLQDAVFTRTDCREATFTSALLYETVFSDTRINSTTTFFDPETTFYDSITSRPGCVYEENPLTVNNLPENEYTADHLPKDTPARSSSLGVSSPRNPNRRVRCQRDRDGHVEEPA